MPRSTSIPAFFFATLCLVLTIYLFNVRRARAPEYPARSDLGRGRGSQLAHLERSSAARSLRTDCHPHPSLATARSHSEWPLADTEDSAALSAPPASADPSSGPVQQSAPFSAGRTAERSQPTVDPRTTHAATRTCQHQDARPITTSAHSAPAASTHQAGGPTSPGASVDAKALADYPPSSSTDTDATRKAQAPSQVRQLFRRLGRPSREDCPHRVAALLRHP